MKIRIIRCSDSMMWYKPHVNEIFEVIPRFPEDKDVFWTREPAGYLNIVLKIDAEIIKDTENAK